MRLIIPPVFYFCLMAKMFYLQYKTWIRIKMLLGFPHASDGKESACNAGDLGSIPGLGRSPGEGNGYPLQYSCPENSTDRGAWWPTVHGVAKCQTKYLWGVFIQKLSDWESNCPFSVLASVYAYPSIPENSELDHSWRLVDWSETKRLLFTFKKSH